jgi:arsenate reductase
MLKVYIYQKCSTCRDALKWLNDHSVAHKSIAIRETPPSVAELQKSLRHFDGNLRKLFNTSGIDYRAMGLKDQLPTMSETEALTLLSKNGNLVKRPFVIGDGVHLVGFDADLWKASLLKR